MSKTTFVLTVLLFVIYVPTLIAQNEPPKIITGGVINGKAVKLVKPEYPQSAKDVGDEGTVNVQVIIDEEGNIISAAAGSGPKSLHKVSEDAALASKFSPTKLEGKPVRVSGVIVYRFVAETGNSKKLINAGIINGKALKLPKPKYPADAKQVHAQGPVSIQVIINEKGEVISATAISGHEMLRKISEEAALNAKFSPTYLKGKPVKIQGVIVYNFLISGNDQK